MPASHRRSSVDEAIWLKYTLFFFFLRSFLTQRLGHVCQLQQPIGRDRFHLSTLAVDLYTAQQHIQVFGCAPGKIVKLIAAAYGLVAGQHAGMTLMLQQKCDNESVDRPQQCGNLVDVSGEPCVKISAPGVKSFLPQMLFSPVV